MTERLFTVAVAERVGDQLEAVGPTTPKPRLLRRDLRSRRGRHAYAWIVPIDDLPMVARTAIRRIDARDDGEEDVAELPDRAELTVRLPSPRVRPEQVERYRAAADAAGVSLSDWIRDTLDAAAG